MLVEVLRLRERGAPLTSAELQAVKPVHGYIRLSKAPTHRMDSEWDRSAILTPDPFATTPTLELHRVRPATWDSRGLVLAGLEETWRRKECTAYRQSWWIRFPQTMPDTIQDSLRLLQTQMDELLALLHRFSG
jgi:hypothetical protein